MKSSTCRQASSNQILGRYTSCCAGINGGGRAWPHRQRHTIVWQWNRRATQARIVVEGPGERGCRPNSRARQGDDWSSNVDSHLAAQFSARRLMSKAATGALSGRAGAHLPFPGLGHFARCSKGAMSWAAGRLPTVNQPQAVPVPTLRSDAGGRRKALRLNVIIFLQ